MTNTGNTGPEGIAFVPDSFLIAAGFISQATGNPYTSVKGMGGLIFIAHQNQGYIWVFDVNPNVSNDFAYVGKYKTNRTESCDLAFDRTTGLLYILHNISSNYLEVTNLSTVSQTGNERKFTTNYEYTISNPAGNVNIEGFAITSKCNDSMNVSAWLARDVESNESSSYLQDCVRWFNPFNAPGSCGNGLAVTINLRILIEGYYKGNGTMKQVLNDVLFPAVCDSVILELHQASGVHALVQSVKGTVDTNGYGTFVFPNAYNNSYYLVVKHRSALEVWSASPVQMNALQINYTFTDSINRAFGNKLTAGGSGTFLLYNGDVNQDGQITEGDYKSVEGKTKLFSTGYLAQDLTGDRVVESSDFILVEKNYLDGVVVSRP
jgi:hypothetical protein